MFIFHQMYSRAFPIFPIKDLQSKKTFKIYVEVVLFMVFIFN